MVSPIWLVERLVGYSVSRAHHSDVGGMQPGIDAEQLAPIFQEGLIIPPIRLVRGGEQQDDVMRLILANVRTPEIRRGDIYAQIAANGVGTKRIGELIDRHGATVLSRPDSTMYSPSGGTADPASRRCLMAFTGPRR